MDGARFNVPLDTKYVISETFFPANLLAGRKYFTVFTKFLCMLLMPVARSSSVGVAVRYVLPALLMTSYLHGPYGQAYRYRPNG